MSVVGGKMKHQRPVFKYYNPFLDDFLIGISNSDFVLLGATTGLGKSEYAYSLAFKNAIDNPHKVVHLFALEADENEPEERFIYRSIARQYYADKPINKIDMSYRNYMYGLIDVSRYEKVAREELAKIDNIEIHYRGKEFTLDTLQGILEMYNNKNQCDLIVLDHIDYFDLIDGLNENEQVTQIMKTLRQFNQDYEVPIVAVSHMRKKSTFSKAKIPSIDDLMGSSNKPKQVKTIILISPDYDNSDYKNNIHSTFFQVPKARIGGATRFIGRLLFDARKNEYNGEYTLMRAKLGGVEVEVVDDYDNPSWYGRKTIEKSSLPF